MENWIHHINTHKKGTERIVYLEIGINLQVVYMVVINAVRSMYMGCSSAVKLGRRISQQFMVTKGLRQGCCLAPTLFKI